MTNFFTAKVRDQNDAFRKSGPLASSLGLLGQWVMSSGVAAQGADFAAEAFRAVQVFADFSAGNDPYGEHDFGSLNIAGQHLFWKIDCFDRSLQYGSPDPTDLDVTCRVLTLMLASEY